MSMWEIDTILVKSIELIKNSNLTLESGKHIVWNLENIPETYEFDAGSFTKSEIENEDTYKRIHLFELGNLVLKEAENQNKIELIYDWSAFVLNFFDFFAKIEHLEVLKSTYLEEMKSIFSKYNFEDYEPIHNTLTIYKNGNEWFSKERNDLMKWYYNK